MFGTVDQIIDALGGTGKVADALGLSPSTISSWRARGSIPAEWWVGLVGLDASSDLTFEALAVLHARRTPEPVEERA